MIRSQSHPILVHVLCNLCMLCNCNFISCKPLLLQHWNFPSEMNKVRIYLYTINYLACICLRLCFSLLEIISQFISDPVEEYSLKICNQFRLDGVIILYLIVCGWSFGGGGHNPWVCWALSNGNCLLISLFICKRKILSFCFLKVTKSQFKVTEGDHYHFVSLTAGWQVSVASEQTQNGLHQMKCVMKTSPDLSLQNSQWNTLFFGRLDSCQRAEPASWTHTNKQRCPKLPDPCFGTGRV